MTDQDQPDKDQLERAFEYYPRLRKVKEYVEEHLDEQITLEGAARVATLQPSYFSTFFKRRVGESFTIWLNRQRISAAKALLTASDAPIERVAFQVGYVNTRTFQRNFRRFVGSSASEYRRHQRNLPS